MLHQGKNFRKGQSIIASTVVIIIAVTTIPNTLVPNALAEAESLTTQEEKHFASLYEAAKAGDLAEVKRLIAEGANLNTFDKEDEMTPLGVAADEGHTEIAKVLLDNGANADLGEGGSSYGNTPLILAILSWNDEIAKALISGGANVNLTCNVDGDDPPLFYAINEDKADIAKALIEAGANPALKSETGQSLLKLAVEFCNPEIVKLLMNADDDVPELHKAALRGDIARLGALLEEGADINMQDEFSITPIEYAIAAGQSDAAQFLLDHGVDINRKTSWMKRSILHLAARAGLIDIVQKLIDRGDIPLNTLSSYGTALHEAAMGGHKEIAELLISKGIPVDSTDRSDRTPLSRVIFKNHVVIVKLLIDKGANVNASGYPGTPLYTAIINGYTEIANLLRQGGAKMTLREAITVCDVDEVKNLISQRADINTDIDITSINNLYKAIEKGNKEIVELLIDKGADINAYYRNNATPLYYAAQYAHEDITELLLTKGADVNAKTNNGSTALHKAVDVARKDIVELLIAGGADVNVRNNAGFTPLYIAQQDGYTEIAELLRKNGAKDISPSLLGAINYGDIEQVKLLISQGADVNSTNNSGRTLLHIACQKNNKEIAELLIEKGADVNAKSSGWTPLHRAARDGRKDIVELLIAKRADVNISNNQGCNPLDIAIENNRTEIIDILKKHGVKETLFGAIFSGNIERFKSLISQGIDVNAKDTSGQTPLHFAIRRQWGKIDIVRLLIEKGADVYAMNGNGDTPLSLAEAQNRKEVVQFLHDYISLKGKVLPEVKDFGIILPTNDFNQKKILVCFFDIEQRPSRHCINQLAERAEQLKQQNIIAVAVQASEIEQEKFNSWIQENNLSFSAGILPGNMEEKLNNWGVKAMPWLILTDTEHVVTAVGFSINELDEKIKTSKEK